MRSQHINRGRINRTHYIFTTVLILSGICLIAQHTSGGFWRLLIPNANAEGLSNVLTATDVGTPPLTPVINALAGIGGIGGYSGDGGPATSSQLNTPHDVDVAADGTVYLADTANHRVRKISGGIITTLVGTGVFGNSGNGGIGTAAEVGIIESIALDTAGHNLYILDSDACVVRRVDVNPSSSTNGHIFAFAGTECNFPAGIPGPAGEAILGFPFSIAVAPDGQVYIADSFFTCSITRVDTSGIIHHFAGVDCASSGDDGPAIEAGFWARQMAFDPAGNLFLGDTGFLIGTEVNANTVRRIDAITNIITTVAGGGTGTAPSSDPTSVNLGNLAALAVDGNDLFVSNPLQVYKLDLTSNVLTVFAGSGNMGDGGDGGPAIDAEFVGISALARRGETLVVSDGGNNRLRSVTSTPAPEPTPTPIVDTIAGIGGVGGFSGDGGDALLAQLNNPQGIAVAPDGTIYFADSNNFRIRKIDIAGVISTIAGTGVADDTGDGGLAINATLSQVLSISLDPATNNLYLSQVLRNRIRRIDLNAGTIHAYAGTGIAGSTGDGGNALLARLNRPQGVSVAPDGSLIIADTNGCRIRRVSGGIITTIAGSGVCDSTGDGGPATSAAFDTPRRVYVDVGGNIFVVDNNDTASNDNNTIRRIDAVSGVINRVAGGGVNIPGTGTATTMNIGNVSDLAVDAPGNLYIGSLARVFRVDLASGILSPYAGTGAFGFSGDGGPAIDAEFNSIRALAFKGEALIISDGGNNRLRAVNPAPAPCAALTLSSSGSTDGAQHVPFSRTISAAGGTGPYTYSLTGQLPAGLILNASTGEISGTPTEFIPGTLYVFTVTATDANGCTGSVDLSMTIEPFSCDLVGNAVTAINGDLVVTGSSATTINLACVVSISGDLVITNNDKAGNLDLGSLTTVGGNVNIAGNTAAGVLDLGSLGTVSGDLVIINNPAGNLDLSLLGTVSGDLDITNSHSSGDLDLGSLTSVGGTINIAQNTTTGDLDLSSLGSAGSSVNIAENASSGDLDLSSLTSTGGTFRIASNGSAAVVSLTSLGTVAGDVDISDNNAASTVGMGALTTVSGDVTIEGNGSAVSVDLGLLQTADSISIGGNTSASTVDLGSLGTAGEVTITGNGAAEVTLDLTSVAGDVTIDSSGTETFSIGDGSPAGSVDLNLSGYTTVTGATAGTETSISNSTNEAVMSVQLPDGTFAAPVSFSITRQDPATLPAAQGSMPDGSPAIIDPIEAYQFTFGVPTLNQDASLVFEILMAGLDPATRAMLLAALESDNATLATLGNEPGDTYQAFAICAADEDPTADGCVRLELLDTNRQPTTGTPDILRFTGVTGHFSTWAVVTTAQPSAANVSVSGRVLAADGRFVPHATIVFTDTIGNVFPTRSTSFGYYRVEGLVAGSTYFVTTTRKGYQFEAVIITPNDDIADFDISASGSPSPKVFMQRNLKTPILRKAIWSGPRFLQGFL